MPKQNIEIKALKKRVEVSQTLHHHQNKDLRNRFDIF